MALERGLGALMGKSASPESHRLSENLVNATAVLIVSALVVPLVAIGRALVPLVVGTVSACIAGAFYAVFLRHANVEPFFSSASSVSVGILLALIINGLFPKIQSTGASAESPGSAPQPSPLPPPGTGFKEALRTLRGVWQVQIHPTPQIEALIDQVRAGTVALAAVGAFCALVGELVTGSGIVRGLLFAFSWGGMTAGLVGLVFFISPKLPAVGQDGESS